MILKTSAVSNYASLAFMSLFTLMAVINNQISVFYIIYLFWFDEFLRTIFLFFRYFFKRETVPNPQVFIQQARSKMFFLFLYFIFIFVFFGLMIDWNNSDLIFINLSALLFKNSLFNITILTFIGSELLLFLKNDFENIIGHILISKGVIVLHISIILGVFIWGFLPKEFYEFSFSNLRSGIIIAPFLLLKLFFELNSSKS